MIDDGWRWEKRDILHALEDGWQFDLATHDSLCRHMLEEDGFAVLELPRYPLKRGACYSLLMFFAQSLDTNLVRYRERIKHLSKPFIFRLFYRLREALGRLHLRPYRYPAALRLLYKGSRKYTDVLSAYDMVVFNPVTVRDKRLLFEAKALGLNVVCWVYSWDNPMKDNEFFVYADDYLVWNEENRQHLVQIHGLKPGSIHVVGPAQFDFYLDRSQEPSSSQEGRANYVLYACALGLDQHLEQEIDMVLKIREIMDELGSELSLWVRPYPFRLNNRFQYERLKGVPGIRLLEFGRADGERIVVSKSELNEKYEQIDNACCLINFGSTLGLEASFTDTPIIQIGFGLPYCGPRHLDVAHAFANEHLRYMIDTRFLNTVVNIDQLRRALQDILQGRTEHYTAYTQHLRRFAHPLDVSSYRAQLRMKLAELEARVVRCHETKATVEGT